MQPFPLIEAFWASIDRERPSGDDPKQVAFALHSFYQDLQKHAASLRESRWKTPLFRKLEPVFLDSLKQSITLSKRLGETWPKATPADLEAFKEHDKLLRTAAFEFEKEEKEFDLPAIESPKLSLFNYLYEGWKRGFSRPEPVKKFALDYLGSIKATQRELTETKKRVNPKESEEEKNAVEAAISAVDMLGSTLQEFLETLSSGPKACETLVNEILKVGKTLGQLFQTLERCAPLTEPCPFCGGQISLSGRCRSCSRRLPHLEESQTDVAGPQSDFLSLNCRALDLAILTWQADSENPELWKAFQQAVRDFAGHVTKGSKELQNLSTNPERPVDRDSQLRKQEATLMEVGKVFQDTLTTLSKFTQSNQPPEERLDSAWKTPLMEAELKLQELESALTPEPASKSLEQEEKTGE